MSRLTLARAVLIYSKKFCIREISLLRHLLILTWMISSTAFRPGRWWEQFCCQFCYLVSSSPVQLSQRQRSSQEQTGDWWRTWSRGWSISKYTTFSLGWALYPLQLPHVDLSDYSVDRILEYSFIDMKNNTSFPSLSEHFYWW